MTIIKIRVTCFLYLYYTKQLVRPKSQRDQMQYVRDREVEIDEPVHDGWILVEVV